METFHYALNCFTCSAGRLSRRCGRGSGPGAVQLAGPLGGYAWRPEEVS
ncbi:hypothetical protein ppKF707_6004 [Metapseudomonas furukawaii]|uniref:Uncharacterized protein n=1 Tax=Metapseudomonas furukawaii TaxID=1149133 RepID=L8MNB5_METFU|nr:hypothetical protein ppKF707_5864 [Pseudomonas furukawaii]ELS28304.1 hypothetical protein ppKF707_6004 [Pseudomonas furukawaii]BAU76327.1 hypothetical protein KF707C_46390 [Pseudomonas furukawaii]